MKKHSSSSWFYEDVRRNKYSLLPSSHLQQTIKMKQNLKLHKKLISTSAGLPLNGSTENLHICVVLADDCSASAVILDLKTAQSPLVGAFNSYIVVVAGIQ